MSKEQPNISAQRIQALYADIAKSITSSLEVSTIINKIMELVHSFFRPANWSLLRVDQEKNELYFVVSEGLDAEKVKDLRLKIGEGVAGHVAETGKSVIVADVNRNNHFNNSIDQLSGFKTTSLVAVPIVFQNKVLGVIELINTLHEKEFTNKELEILETIADFSAIALNNAIIHEQITFLANHDPLTELYNRAFLATLFSSNSNNASFTDFDDTYSIAILIDVNHFKQINDQFGHVAGDKVLIRLAELLKTYCRKSDYVFRVGGDEFLMILTNLDVEEIPALENEMTKKLNAFLEKAALDFSFSYGIASGRNTELEQLINNADQKMYQAKHARTNEKISS